MSLAITVGIAAAGVVVGFLARAVVDLGRRVADLDDRVAGLGLLVDDLDQQRQTTRGKAGSIPR